jgi:hypothetical protein
MRYGIGRIMQAMRSHVIKVRITKTFFEENAIKRIACTNTSAKSGLTYPQQDEVWDQALSVDVDK